MSASTESSLLYTHCWGQTSSCKSLTHSLHFFVSFPFSLSLLIYYFNWAGSWFHTLSFVPPQTWLLLSEIKVRWCAWRCHQVQSASRCVCIAFPFWVFVYFVICDLGLVEFMFKFEIWSHYWWLSINLVERWWGLLVMMKELDIYNVQSL